MSVNSRTISSEFAAQDRRQFMLENERQLIHTFEQSEGLEMLDSIER